jgi:hypothetical protein
LEDVEVELVSTEHESMEPRDLAAVQEAIGVSLGLNHQDW